MKKIALAAVLAGTASTAMADGHVTAKGDVVMEPVVIVEETQQSSSSAGVVIPIMLLLVVAAAAAN